MDFFYTGQEYELKCFRCQLVIKGPSKVEVWKDEHSRLSPQCPLVNHSCREELCQDSRNIPLKVYDVNLTPQEALCHFTGILPETIPNAEPKQFSPECLKKPDFEVLDLMRNEKWRRKSYYMLDKEPVKQEGPGPLINDLPTSQQTVSSLVGSLKELGWDYIGPVERVHSQLRAAGFLYTLGSGGSSSLAETGFMNVSPKGKLQAKAVASLAKAGFFSNGPETQTCQCAFCRCILPLDRLVDHPVVEHVALGPCCPLLNEATCGNIPLELQHSVTSQLNSVPFSISCTVQPGKLN